MPARLGLRSARRDRPHRRGRRPPPGRRHAAARPAGGHGCAADRRGHGARLQQLPRRAHARLRPRRTHRDAARRGTLPGGDAAFRRYPGTDLPARRGRPGRRRGDARRRAAGALSLRCAVRHAQHAGTGGRAPGLPRGTDDGFPGPAERHPGGRRWTRFDAAPERRSVARRVERGDGPAERGGAQRRSAEGRGGHGRRIAGRRGGQRHTPARRAAPEPAGARRPGARAGAAAGSPDHRVAGRQLWVPGQHRALPGLSGAGQQRRGNRVRPPGRGRTGRRGAGRRRHAEADGQRGLRLDATALPRQLPVHRQRQRTADGAQPGL
ncbi:hypothetical protein PALA56_04591 [Pseudomonas aeruginosa]|nr:hypothetical protein PALA56_04591 [Pseudomonas aeruginosa]